MATTLITVGLACLTGAIAGGSFKGLGVELPVISSLRRQIILASLGIGLITTGAIARYRDTLPSINATEELAEGKASKAAPDASRSCGIQPAHIRVITVV